MSPSRAMTILSYAIEYGLIDVLNVKVGRMGGPYQRRPLLIFVRECHIP